jgi:hypothetical protein
MCCYTGDRVARAGGRSARIKPGGDLELDTTAHRPTVRPNRSSKSAQRIEFDQLQTAQNNELLSTRQPSDIGTLDRSSPLEVVRHEPGSGVGILQAGWDVSAGVKESPDVD